MCRITVLSPHFDDAAFSLGLSLLNWREHGLDLTVINFFTVSAFAPRRGSRDSATARDLREREDRRALGLISPDIRVESLGLLDAPLRLGLPVASVFTLDVEPDEIQALEPLIGACFRRGPVIAPLGLGNHIDHLTVRTAAAKQARRDLAFYEDLPYAAWTPERDLRERVQQMEEVTRTRLRPMMLRRAHAIATKRRIAGLYQSQIDRNEADLIARFASNYGGGERIWVPTPASRRMAILNRSK